MDIPPVVDYARLAVVESHLREENTSGETVGVAQPSVMFVIIVGFRWEVKRLFG
jgi:hypothetical protein